MNALVWLAESPVGHAVRESLWMYPTLLTLHAVGMAVVVGSLVMIDLRVLGFARSVPMSSLDQLYPVVLGGFIVNLLSGFLLFVADAPRFAGSAPFLTKISCIVVAGILAWLLAHTLANEVSEDVGQMPGVSRALAALSLVSWGTAVTAGRLTAYL